jgi:hypothetical protein
VTCIKCSNGAAGWIFAALIQAGTALINGRTEISLQTFLRKKGSRPEIFADERGSSMAMVMVILCLLNDVAVFSATIFMKLSLQPVRQMSPRFSVVCL